MLYEVPQVTSRVRSLLLIASLCVSALAACGDLDTDDDRTTQRDADASSDAGDLADGDTAVDPQVDPVTDPDATADPVIDTEVVEDPVPDDNPEPDAIEDLIEDSVEDAVEDEDGTPEELEIIGTWTDDWGAQHEITATIWDMSYAATPEYDSTFHIAQYDNESESLIAQNDASNPFNGGAWSRFDWVWVDSELWFCQTSYDAATEEAAAATPRADDTDPATGGCGVSTWSHLSP